MSTFWSLYVTLLTLGTLVAMAWLLLSTRKGQRPDLTEQTLDHTFDGIEEYDNPLPTWWCLLFGATLLFSLGYLALYPGLGNWQGWLPGYAYLDEQRQVQFANGEQGWSSVHQWEREQAAADARFGPIFARFAAMPIEAVAKDPQALKMGARLFASNCATCHGADARGAYGFPNLTDSDWRWGGDPQAIKTSILNGRIGVMPAWGAALGDQGVADVTAWVISGLQARPLPAELKANPGNGQALYATMCIACHGPQGKGNPLLGAPDLTRPQHLMYGSSVAQLQDSIRLGRQGQMPAQQVLQGNDRVHLLAAYVYSLSQPAAAPPPEQP